MQTMAGRIMLLGAAVRARGLRRRELSGSVLGRPVRDPGRHWLEFGPGKLVQRLATFKWLGVPLVRFTLRWNEIARRRPKCEGSPTGIARTTGIGPDKVMRGLRRHGLTPVLTIVGAPPWANGGRTANFAAPHA